MGIISDGMELLKLANRAANAELYSKLGEWIEKVETLKAQNETLQETNKDLREKLKFKGQFIRLNGYVFIDGDNEPLCSRCADVDNKPVHLLSLREQGRGDFAKCPQCKSEQRFYRRRTQVEETIKANVRSGAGEI